jgi:hypothetical protein
MVMVLTFASGVLDVFIAEVGLLNMKTNLFLDIFG